MCAAQKSGLHCGLLRCVNVLTALADDGVGGVSLKGVFMKSTLRFALGAGVSALCCAVLSPTAALAAPTCYNLGYGGVASAKPNKLYLYMPTAADAAFGEFGIGQNTSPLGAFDASTLTNYTGTTAALRDRIFDIVVDDYCEFNVEVLQTTTTPPGTAARRRVVGIGTDGGGCSFGIAEAVDTGDSDVIDNSRVWGGAYQSCFGASELNGANSTLGRWARGIGGTAAHEAAHNYGLSHSTVVAAGEDAFNNHIMPAGGSLTGEDRVGSRRHFSNREYEILAANVGLSVQTMWNWDFVNPNAGAASRLRMTFLSSQPSLAVVGPYTGNLSPWGAPTVSAALGTQVYKGTTYNRYQVTWMSPQGWSGPTPGVVAGGGNFHVGTGFSGVNYNVADAIIITNVELLDASGNPLALHPRIVGFDNGAADTADGSFSVQAFNFLDAPLLISDLRIELLPRWLSIDAMVARAEKNVDLFGEPVTPWAGAKLEQKEMRVTAKESAKIKLRSLREGPHFLSQITEKDCFAKDNLTGEQDVAKCTPGMTASLFPSTSTYIVATVTDPAAKYWDAVKKEYLTGPLSSRVYYQFQGRHPDLNRNSIDDFVEMAQNAKLDRDNNGVIDNWKRTPPRRLKPTKERLQEQLKKIPSKENLQ